MEIVRATLLQPERLLPKPHLRNNANLLDLFMLNVLGPLLRQVLRQITSLDAPGMVDDFYLNLLRPQPQFPGHKLPGWQ